MGLSEALQNFRDDGYVVYNNTGYECYPYHTRRPALESYLIVGHYDRKFMFQIEVFEYDKCMSFYNGSIQFDAGYEIRYRYLVFIEELNRWVHIFRDDCKFFDSLDNVSYDVLRGTLNRFNKFSKSSINKLDTMIMFGVIKNISIVSRVSNFKFIYKDVFFSFHYATCLFIEARGLTLMIDRSELSNPSFSIDKLTEDIIMIGDGLIDGKFNYDWKRFWLHNSADKELI